MKFRIFYILLSLFFVAGVTFNFSSGPAAGNDLDRTGSPLAGGAFCQQCHTAGAFNPSLDIKLMDGTDEVTSYMPGRTYKLVLTNMADMNPAPAVYGFQTTILDANDVFVGAFGTEPTDMRITPLNGVDYWEHRRRLTTNTVEIDWTAPDAGTGAVNIYSATIAANGAAGTAGDGAANGTLEIPESGVGSTNNFNNGTFQIRLLANPIADQLPVSIKSNQFKDLNVSILDLNGRTAQTEKVQITQGEQVINLNTSNLEKGIYFLQLTDGQSVTTQKVLKL